MPTDTINCIGYLRVSTERQADEVHTSLADQEEAVRALAEKMGAEVGQWFRDEGASGATVAGRPAFRELLSFCEAHRRPASSPGLVLILNDSRFGRFPDPDEAAYWRHHLQRKGWIVRFAEGDEVEGHFRTVVRAIGSAQATEYRQNLIRNTRRGMKGAASEGFWTREAPYGYRRRVVYPPSSARILEIGQLKAPNEKVKLVPHPEESRIVRWVYETYADGGQSLGSLAEKLLQKVPGRRWSRTVVGAMIRNPVYRGDIVGGRRRDGASVMYGCEDAHHPIVSRDLWHQAQARMEKNAHRPGPDAQTDYLMTGLLICPHCGFPYTGGGGGRGKSAIRQRRRFYRDSGGVAKACPGRIGTVMRHLVDDRVLEVLASTLEKPAVVRQIERAIDEALEAMSGPGGESEALLKAARARLEQRRARLVDAIGDGTLLPEEAAPRLEQVRGELSEIEARRQVARFHRRRGRRAQAERDQIMETIQDFPALLDHMGPAKRREAVEIWVQDATFDKVTRMLTLGIRPVPALPSLLMAPPPGRGNHQQIERIVRSTSLLQPGHGYRIAEAAAAIRRDRRRA